MNMFITILICLIQFITIIKGTILPKYLASCVVLRNDTYIYCYSGGYNTVGDKLIMEAQPDHHYLDLTQDGLVVGNIAAKWVDVPSDPKFTLEPAIGGTPIKLSDTTYLIDGGYSVKANKRNQTTVFDSSTNTWSTLSNQGRNLSGSIYGETGVYISKKQRLVFWGGLTGEHPGTIMNMSTIYNIGTGGPWKSFPYKFNDSMSRFGHTATYDEDGQQIIYIGGRTRQLSNPFVPIQNITIFNTVTLDWSIKRANAQTNITNRFLHTTTRIPSSGLLIIYGGATGDDTAPIPVPDYLYLFNPKTLEYTQLAENNTISSAGPRFGHSAILSDNTLIILFGGNGQGAITDDVYFLSLNGAATTWLKQFRLPIDMSPDSSLAVKDIIGITVGSVICVMMIAFAIWYFIRRNKKKKQQQEIEQRQSEDDQEEPVYVMENTLNDSIPSPLNVYKPNQIVSNYRSSPLLESQTIKPSL